jgi:MerR family transcriptional regulator/heat shock protein HspR
VVSGDTGSRTQRLEHQDVGKYVMSVAVRLSGVGAARIRRYESTGFLSPVRTEGGQRLFSDRDIAAIRDVAELETKGVNLKGVKVIIAMRHQPAERRHEPGGQT